MKTTTESSAPFDPEFADLTPEFQTFLISSFTELQRYRNQHQSYSERLESAIEDYYLNHRAEIDAYPFLAQRYAAMRRKLGCRLKDYGLNRQPSLKVIARVFIRLGCSK